MTTRETISFAAYCAPMISALVCCLLLLFNRRNTPGATLHKASRLMSAAYASAVLLHIGIVLYMAGYRDFTSYHALFLLFALLNQIFPYHVMFTLTGTGVKETFNPLHYAVPMLIAGALGLWSFTPSEGQYALLSDTLLPLLCLYNAFYAVKVFRRIAHYRKAVADNSSGDSRISLRWLRVYPVLLLVMVPIPLAVWLAGQSTLMTAVFGVLKAFAAICQYVIVCYNLVLGNVVLITPGSEEEQANPAERQHSPHRPGLPERRQLEQYMNDYKPYLNPSLKMTDLAAMLRTNRTSLSTLINTTYHMNFSRYINHLRVNEMEVLRKTLPKEKATETDLAYMAGFADYRNYLRQKQAMEERKRTP